MMQRVQEAAAEATARGLLAVLDPAAREAIATVTELAAGAGMVGLAELPPELLEAVAELAQREGIPPELVHAAGHVLARVELSDDLEEAATTIGRYLRENPDRGIAGAVLAAVYAIGSRAAALTVEAARELAGDVMGHFTILLARKLDPARLSALTKAVRAP